jgi:hypothetical protein
MRGNIIQTLMLGPASVLTWWSHHQGPSQRSTGKYTHSMPRATCGHLQLLMPLALWWTAAVWHASVRRGDEHPPMARCQQGCWAITGGLLQGQLTMAAMEEGAAHTRWVHTNT